MYNGVKFGSIYEDDSITFDDVRHLILTSVTRSLVKDYYIDGDTIPSSDEKGLCINNFTEQNEIILALSLVKDDLTFNDPEKHGLKKGSINIGCDDNYTVHIIGEGEKYGMVIARMNDEKNGNIICEDLANGDKFNSYEDIESKIGESGDCLVMTF